jgi:hypothetical protein
MSARRICVHRIDRRDVPSGAVDVEHGSAQLLLDVAGDHARAVTADLHVLAAHHRAMHGVVHHQRDRRAVGTPNANQVDLSIDRTIGIQAEGDLSVDISGAAVDVRVGDRGRHRKASGLQFVPCRPHRVNQRIGELFRVFTVPLVIRPAKQCLVHVRRTNFWGRVRMGDAPPDVRGVNAGSGLQLAHHRVVEAGREEAYVSGN